MGGRCTLAADYAQRTYLTTVWALTEALRHSARTVYIHADASLPLFGFGTGTDSAHPARLQPVAYT